MHWHWRNENEGGSALRHGRAWLHIGDACWCVEWGLWPKWKRLSLEVATGGCENDYALRIAGWVFSLYLNVQGLRAFGAMQRDWPRTTGIHYGDDHLTLQWNCDDSSWSSKTGPAHGWYKGWFVRDVIFGRAEHSSVEVAPATPALVQMPEGSYPCTVALSQDTWKRPRWPKPVTIRRAQIDIPGGVPFPGKGENSYDCGEDATYGMTCPAATVEEAVAALQASVQRSRLKYGGPNWIPERAQ